MPLVPTAIYEAWFAKTSWVYQSFSYLFQNPLWNRPVPRGASLCPLFWAALFSLVVFRPLVYLTLGVGAMVKALRLQRLIAWTDSISFVQGPPVLPTVALVMLTALGGLLLFGLGSVAVECWQAGVFGAFALPVVLIATFVTTLLYWESTRHDPNRCKVEVYARIVTVLCVVSAFVFHPAYAYGSFVQFPIDLVIGLWHAIGIACSAVWGFFWGGAKWLVNFLPWVLGLAVLLGGYGWVAMRWANAPVTPGTNVETVSTAERKRRLKELAAQCCFHDGRTDTTRSWWMRVLYRCDDLLEAYLNAPVWNMWAVKDALDDQLAARAEAIRLQELAAYEHRAAKCRAVTNVLAKVLAPLGAALKQVVIFGSYLSQLVKARKQGACPYLTFRD